MNAAGFNLSWIKIFLGWSTPKYYSKKLSTLLNVEVFLASIYLLLIMLPLLVEPVEKCKNYDELIDTIDKLEWRMAWKGNSRITFGIKSAAKMQDSLNFPSKILFFTDGDEAPKVNAINRGEFR